jgi:hypothetical protein
MTMIKFLCLSLLIMAVLASTFGQQFRLSTPLGLDEYFPSIALITISCTFIARSIAASG